MQTKNQFEVETKSSGSGDNHSESHSSTGQVLARTSQAKAKLPKLTLPKFRGEFTKWNTFWDSFPSAVHDNPEISKVDKFNYLNSVLEEPEARAVAGLTLGTLRFATARGYYGYIRSKSLPVTSPCELQYDFPALASFSAASNCLLCRTLH